MLSFIAAAACALVLPTAAQPECYVLGKHGSYDRDMECFRRKYPEYFDAIRDFEPQPSPDGSVCNQYFCNATTESLRDTDPKRFAGHLGPFGEQGQVDPGVTEVQGCIGAKEFMREYVFRHKPVVMRGCGLEVRATSLWTPEYFLSDELRTWKPLIETAKEMKAIKVNHTYMSMSEFFDSYQSNPYYLINELDPESLKADVNLPPPLQCTRSVRQMKVAYLWYSSGWTESALHYDAQDNVHWMVEGSKEILLVDPIHSREVYHDFHDRVGFSPINVRRVDLNVYPRVRDANVYKVNITRGDMLYIPYVWWHLVRSGNEPGGSNVALSLAWDGARDVGSVGKDWSVDKNGLASLETNWGSSFSTQLIETALKFRSGEGLGTLTRDGVCGGVVKNATLAEIPCMEDRIWTRRGFKPKYGFPELRRASDFFDKFISPRAQLLVQTSRAGAFPGELQGHRAMCALTSIAWVIGKESVAFVLDFRTTPPSFRRVSLPDFDRRGYHVVYDIADGRGFLDYLSKDESERYTVLHRLVRDKGAVVTVQRGDKSTRTNTNMLGDFELKVAKMTEECITAVLRLATYADYLAGGTGLDLDDAADQRAAGYNRRSSPGKQPPMPLYGRIYRDECLDADSQGNHFTGTCFSASGGGDVARQGSQPPSAKPIEEEEVIKFRGSADDQFDDEAVKMPAALF